MTGVAIWTAMVLAVPFMIGVAIGIEIRRRKPVVEQVLVEVPYFVDDPYGEAVRAGIRRVADGQALMGADMMGALTVPLTAEGRPTLYLIVATTDLAAKYERACSQGFRP